jgi:hypothetical protein
MANAHLSLRKDFDRKLECHVEDMIHSMPIQIAGIHALFDSKVPSVVHPFLLSMFGRKFRSRYRLYGANDKESRAQRLLECGIFMDVLPTPRMGGGSPATPEVYLELRCKAEGGIDGEGRDAS